MNDMPDSLFTVQGLKAVLLTKQSAPVLQKLLGRCSDYFKLVEGRTARSNAAMHKLTDTPPGFGKENLLCIGLWRSPTVLVGVIIALRHYPRENQWYISLFMLDPAWRGLKIGRTCYFAFEDWVKSQNAEAIFLTVVAPNKRAAQFWESVGFGLPRCYPPARFGLKRHILVEYEKTLVE